MRPINKGVEPHLLTVYRAKPNAVYDGPNFTPVKNEIRKQLLVEQGYLCAYCMQRIYDDQLRTKIDHWHCQDNYPTEQLRYPNLLAVCNGNQGCPKRLQHCDTLKGNDDIKYNPSKPSHHNKMRIIYSTTGSISSLDSTFSDELDKVLNLNLKRFKDNRASVIDSVVKALGTSPGSRTVPEIRKLIAIWEQADADGALREYCDVAVFFLKKRLAKTTA